jgi:hypothetical protein
MSFLWMTMYNLTPEEYQQAVKERQASLKTATNQQQ